MTAEGRSSAMHKYFSHAQPDNNALGIYDKRPATLLPLPPVPHAWHVHPADFFLVYALYFQGQYAGRIM